jgi:hypothetical protein
MTKARTYFRIVGYDLIMFLLFSTNQQSLNPGKWNQITFDTFAAYLIFGTIFILIAYSNEVHKTNS